jgi:hypothetical protein
MTNRIVSLFRKRKLYGVRPDARKADYPAPKMLEQPPFLGKWAVLSYYVPDKLIHPEDAKRYLEGKTKGGLLFECINDEGAWGTITNNKGESFRVNPKHVLWVNKPEYDLGQEVETANGTHRIGNIATRVWHFKEKQFAYLIEITGKNNKRNIHNRRYWSNDLTTTKAYK